MFKTVYIGDNRLIDVIMKHNTYIISLCCDNYTKLKNIKLNNIQEKHKTTNTIMIYDYSDDQICLENTNK